MADTSSDLSASKQKHQLTLTKAEIAFINATIELMQEEETGRTQSVTIAVDSPAAFPKALVKTAKKVNQWVENNGGWLAVAALATDALWGFTSASSGISREQAETFDKLRTAAQRGLSLEELIELRDRLEGQEPPKAKSVKSKSKSDYEQTKGSSD